MKRYTYSRTVKTSEGNETFTADQFDSFDEAINAVNKGIYERELFLAEKQKTAALKNLPVEEVKTPEIPQNDIRKDMHPVGESSTGTLGGGSGSSTAGGASA